MQKKNAFLQGDKIRIRELKEEIRRKTRLAKTKYKDRVEMKLTSGNTKQHEGLKHHDGESVQPCLSSRTAKQLLHPFQ